MLNNTKSKKQLSPSQIRLLRLIFKFRFVNSELLAKYLGKDRSTIYERLATLVKLGYLDKQYDSSYKLAGRPATYSLAAKGIRILLHLTNGYLCSPTGLRNMYRNAAITPAYIHHCLIVFDVFISLKQRYDDTYVIFSKNELSGLDFFPTIKPDLYLSAENPPTRPSYMLDVFDNTANFMTRRKRLKSLFAHEASGAWDDEEVNYPSYLFVVIDDKIQARLMKEVDYYYNRSYVNEEEITTHITTLNKLTNSTNKNIWHLYIDRLAKDELSVINDLK